MYPVEPAGYLHGVRLFGQPVSHKLFLQRFGCTAKEYRRRLAECAPVDGEAPEPSPDSPVATERIWSVPQSLAWLAECGLAGERTETDGGAD